MDPSLADTPFGKLEKKAAQAANAMKSLSNKWRLMILCQLVGGEKSVGELLEAVELSQSALSQHLAVLRANGLVSTRRESQSIFYSVKGREAPVILAALYDVYCAAPDAPAKKSRAKVAKPATRADDEPAATPG